MARATSWRPVLAVLILTLGACSVSDPTADTATPQTRPLVIGSITTEVLPEVIACQAPPDVPHVAYRSGTFSRFTAHPTPAEALEAVLRAD